MSNFIYIIKWIKKKYSIMRKHFLSPMILWSKKYINRQILINKNISIIQVLNSTGSAV